MSRRDTTSTLAGIAYRVTSVPPRLLLVGLLLVLALVFGVDPAAAENYCWLPGADGCAP